METELTIIIVTIWNENDLWIAAIDGGWWVGHGKTKEAAIKSAIKAFETEMEKL